MTTPTRTPYGGGAIGSLSAGHSPHRRPDERIARFVAEALDDRAREHFDRALRADLESGAWDEEFGHLRSRPTYEGSLVIVRATP
ncbi:hypothetical protein [Streptomyces sp. NPDC054946]